MIRVSIMMCIVLVVKEIGMIRIVSIRLWNSDW